MTFDNVHVDASAKRGFVMAATNRIDEPSLTKFAEFGKRYAAANGSSNGVGS